MDWALFISIFALVVAIVVPTIFFWLTKPKIRVFFTCIPYDGLICMIQNVPIRRILSELGIAKQDIRDLHISFEIYEEKTYKRLFFSTQYRDLSFGFDNKVGKHATLPASMTRMIVYIVKIKPGADFVDFIRPGPDYIVIPLSDEGDESTIERFENGTYEARLHIYIDQKRMDYVRDFVVSNTYPYASWVIDDMDKYREGLVLSAKTEK